jgi:hypothetical protein
VILAGAGTAAYLIEFQPSPAQAQHPAALPTRVASTETVGLIGEAAQAPAGSQLIQLLGSGDSVIFSQVPPADAVDGHPEWIADQMTDGTYIFIYLPTSDCLTASGPASHASLSARHCDLSLDQRWRQLSAPVLSDGHDFYEFASAADGKCITQGAGAPAQPALSGCDPARPASQLLAFWWSAS